MPLNMPPIDFTGTTINIGDDDEFVTKMQQKDVLLNNLQTNINAFGGEANSAIAALQASNGSFYQGVTSTTSFLIGVGSKTFVVADKKAFAVGNRCRVIGAVATNWMEGDITAVTATSITVAVDVVGGSGTLAVWTFALTGARGAIGTTGAGGATGATGAVGAGYDDVTSSTSATISSTGAITLTINKRGAFAVNGRVRLANSSTNWMEGVITAISASSVTVNRDKSAGSGAFAAWVMTVAGQPGVDAVSGVMSITAELPLVIDATTPAAPIVKLPAAINMSFMPRGLGLYATNAATSLALGVIAGVAGRMMLLPVWVGGNIEEVGIEVTTPLAGSFARIVIYGVDVANLPGARLYQSANLDCATAGYKSAAPALTLPIGWYWFGVHYSATQSLRGVAVGASMSIGQSTSAQTTINTCIQRTVTFGSAPATWTGTTASEVVSAIVPLIKWR